MTIRVNSFEISFSSSILHHTYRMFYRVSLINVSKTVNTYSFCKMQFMVQRTGVNKKYMVLFSPDFECKVNFLNLYVIDNYVKRTTERCIPQIE